MHNALYLHRKCFKMFQKKKKNICGHFWLHAFAQYEAQYFLFDFLFLFNPHNSDWITLFDPSDYNIDNKNVNVIYIQ